jgi:hypothetical protein
MGCVTLGGVSNELSGSGAGITGWTLAGLDGAGEIDGLPTTRVEKVTSLVAISTRVDSEHRDGAIAVDHVVIVTPDFDRTASALAAVSVARPEGWALTTRGGLGQAFLRGGVMGGAHE